MNPFPGPTLACKRCPGMGRPGAGEEFLPPPLMPSPWASPNTQGSGGKKGKKEKTKALTCLKWLGHIPIWPPPQRQMDRQAGAAAAWDRIRGRAAAPSGEARAGRRPAESPGPCAGRWGCAQGSALGRRAVRAGRGRLRRLLGHRVEGTTWQCAPAPAAAPAVPAEVAIHPRRNPSPTRRRASFRGAQ